MILYSLGAGIICLFKKHFKEVVASRYTSSSNYRLVFTASLPSAKTLLEENDTNALFSQGGGTGILRDSLEISEIL